MLALIWIQTVWHSDNILERFFFENVNFEKINRRQKKNKKLPRMQRIKQQITLQHVYFIWSFTSSQQFFSYVRIGLPGLNQYKQKLMCLAWGQNTVARVRLESATPQSWVKHSTTEPLCSITACDYPPLNTKEHMVNVLKFRTLFSFFSQIKRLVIRTGNHKILVRIANRKDLDKTTQSWDSGYISSNPCALLKKQSDLGLHCLFRPFWLAISVRCFRTSTVANNTD